MASANGCSEFFSTDADNWSNFSLSIFPLVTISVTRGFPSVIVPVLSIITVFIVWAVSKASADLISIPFSAPFPVPTIIAVGVAKPKAHGQEITNTAIPIDKANSNEYPRSNQVIVAIIAIAITTGTKTLLILSANLAIGALEELASSTNFIICDKTVSSPSFVTSNLKDPDLFILAPITLSPTFFSTGRLSPVSIDSSIDVRPSIIIPSVGMLWPGFTITISFKTNSSTGISTSSKIPVSLLVLRTKAVFGAKSISFLIASDVLPFALASKNFPSVIKARTTAADSKYKSIENCITISISPYPNP